MMSEYIEREAVLKVLPPKCNAGDIYALAYNTCLNTIEILIKESPTADVVPVVRCKDCVYWDGLGYSGRCEGYQNGLMSDYTNYDDYCSYGERRCEDEKQCDSE